MIKELVGELEIRLIEIIWKRKCMGRMSRASVTADNVMLSNIYDWSSERRRQKNVSETVFEKMVKAI